jgi:hypothetical protein
MVFSLEEVGFKWDALAGGIQALIDWETEAVRPGYLERRKSG